MDGIWISRKVERVQGKWVLKGQHRQVGMSPAHLKAREGSTLWRTGFHFGVNIRRTFTLGGFNAVLMYHQLQVTGEWT